MLKAYIDLGHDEAGDPDRGAVCGQFVEHDMVQIYGNALAECLINAGWEVKVKESGLSINESAAAANAFGADIVISCHINAGGGDRGEVIYSVRSAGSEALANVICRGFEAAGQTVTRTYTKLNNRGTDYFGILRLTKAHACIAEPFFLDNSIDRTIGDTVEELRFLGYCIGNALVDTYGGNIKEDEDDMVRYRTLNEIPTDNGFQDTIRTLMDARIINGDGSDPVGNNDVIDLSIDMVRMLIFNYRGGCYDAKLKAIGLQPAVK